MGVWGLGFKGLGVKGLGSRVGSSSGLGSLRDLRDL